MRTFRAPAPRGSILDRNGDVLVSNKPGTAVQLWPAALDQATPERQQYVLHSSLRCSTIPYTEIQVRPRCAEGRPPDADHDQGRTSRRTRSTTSSSTRTTSRASRSARLTQRHYDQGGIAAQILGLRQRDLATSSSTTAQGKGYAAGDRIGQTGVEAAYDTYLRGLPGIGRVYVDALGRVKSAREYQQLPEAGDNVRLTIDAGLQTNGRGGARLRHPHRPRRRALGGRRRRARRHGPEHRRDPRARVEPDLRPAHLHGPGRQEGPQAARRSEREPPDARPRHRGPLSAGVDLQAGDRARRPRGPGFSRRTSSSSARRRRSSTARRSRTGTPT